MASKKDMKKVYKSLDYLVEHKDAFETVAHEILQQDLYVKDFEKVYNFLFDLRDGIDYVFGEEGVD